MTKRYIAGLAAVAALTVAGCGGMTTSSTTTAAPAAATHAATPVSAQQSGTGFYNMDTLAGDLKLKVGTKLMTSEPGVSVTDVSCMMTGTQTAECHGDFSNGETANVAVSISQDGDTYMTQG